MSNPRKFSEKIAMHAQKQAEGTAAFEAILKEVSATTRAALAKKSANLQTSLTTSSQPTFLPTRADQQPYRPSVASSQYLADQRSSVVYRGRSLPNVNQMASHKSIDLQKALSSLENMKHEAMGRSTSTGGRCVEKLFPRGQMERSSSQPRKHFSLTRHRDCSPYGSVYLSPPNDPSWRRVSSDSAIHSNILGNQSHCGSKIVLNTEHVGSSDNITVSFAGIPKQPCNTQFWQVPEGSCLIGYSQKTVAGRPKSCDVPGINIFPTSEIQNAGGMAIAIAMQQTPSTPSGGSLPNLNKNPLQAGNSNPNVMDKEPSGDTIAQYYLQQPRLQRQTIPAPLVLKDSNFIVMDSLMYDNAMLLRGQSHQQNSPSLTNCQYSTNSPNLIITNENSPHQMTPNMNSHQLLQYQQQQQLILQQCHLVQQHDSQQSQTAPGIIPQSSGQLCQSSAASLSSPLRGAPSTNYPQPLFQAVLTQGVNVQPLSGHQQVAQETDYNSFTFSPDCAPKLRSQQPLKGHFFPIQNLNNKPPGSAPTHVILSSNVLAEAAAKQQAAVAAAVARSNNLSTAKGLSFANIVPLADNSESQKIFYNSHEPQQSHTNVLQQKFQQISVGKNLSIDYTLDGITLQPLSPPLANFVLVQNNDLSNWIPQTFVASPNNNTCSRDIVMLDNELINDNSSATILQQQHPSSSMRVIPDIIFTDFVNSSQERPHNPQQNSQQMQSPDDCKEALNALSYLSDAFEGEIFTSEDALKLALDPLEMEELQMLADSSVFTDPATEDSFRLDRP